MSEIRRYEPVDNDGFYDSGNIKDSRYGDYVEFADYEYERLAHEATKKNSAITVQALLIEQEAHEATRKELEELQDAIAMRARQRVAMGNNSKEYHLTLNLIYPGQGLRDEILINAIKASKKRNK